MLHVEILTFSVLDWTLQYNNALLSTLPLFYDKHTTVP